MEQPWTPSTGRQGRSWWVWKLWLVLGVMALWMLASFLLWLHPTVVAPSSSPSSPSSAPAVRSNKPNRLEDHRSSSGAESGTPKLGNGGGGGTWVGNHWIPPAPYKLYSVPQLQTIFAGRRMLWIGDSTARRAAMNVFAILNHTPHTNTTTSSISVGELERSIDVNRRSITERCTDRSWSASHAEITVCRRPALLSTNHTTPKNTTTATDVTWLRANCVQDLSKFVRSELEALNSSSPRTTTTTTMTGTNHSSSFPFSSNTTTTGQRHHHRVPLLPEFDVPTRIE